MERVDVAVLGAGPAGLAAAATSAAYGLGTLVLDENPTPGGQIWRGAGGGAQRPVALAAGDAEAATAVAAAQSAGAELKLGAAVWNVASDGTIAWTTATGSYRVEARALILAPGAMERPVPFLGWTLPGVLGVGALQMALKGGGIVPNTPWILAGQGPLALLVLAQLSSLGAPPAAILDTSPAGGLARCLRHLPGALGAASELVRGLGLLWQRSRAGVAIVTGVRSLEARGTDRLEAVVAHTNRREYRYEVELLAIHEGLVPQTSAARLLGVEHRWNDLRRCFEPIVDGFGRVGERALWIVGDGAGIEGRISAALQGRLAGLGVAAALGRLNDRDLEAAPLLSARHRQQKLRRFLDARFPPPRSTLADEIVVCRCEHVTAGAIRAAVAAGADGADRVKTLTRCGMGHCQARMCGLALTELVAMASGKAPGAVGALRIRPPLKPIRLDDLVALAE